METPNGLAIKGSSIIHNFFYIKKANISLLVKVNARKVFSFFFFYRREC